MRNFNRNRLAGGSPRGSQGDIPKFKDSIFVKPHVSDSVTGGYYVSRQILIYGIRVKGPGGTDISWGRQNTAI